MRYTPLLAFGLGQVALAQNSTFTWSSTTSSGANPTETALVPGFPEQLGDFRFFGCLASSENFPTFELIASSDEMSLDVCAASCPGRFMGVYNTDCYCGDEVNSDDTQRVANSQCDVACPGNELEACGGLAGAGAVARRQSVPLSVLLSVYIRFRDSAVTSGAVPTGTMTAAPTGTSTITETITDTLTITSCAPEVTDCPIGQVTTTTYTTEYCPEPTSKAKVWHEKVLICYGDYCAPQLACTDCAKHRVVCEGDVCHPEVCTDDEYYKKVVCHGDDCVYPTCEGDDCLKKVVCYGDHCIPAKCYGDECEKNLVCHGDECLHETCQGEHCYEKYECKGDDCKVVPACVGEHCPTPAPPARKPTHADPVCYGAHCPAVVPTAPPAKGDNAGQVKCVGEHCDNYGQDKCVGEHCDNYGENKCVGAHCDIPVAGSGKVLPALGMGAIAGMAFLL
ncbi:uncharacterized protein J7T54_006602 [Emericellopsis cladophorae]|uniref:WSC domain-containing protein n=1 Tax=Emericellopsis cladophorae TaxID=2686198 RepID=A0A9P9Y6U9_9HYPO|nr:uncharacterized protein J7T54_006602 [Emericellopsis cladophorae]KAI6784557.1 hypothetical protein J7T54_006602 [Emericellopsis cladophorae]